VSHTSLPGFVPSLLYALLASIKTLFPTFALRDVDVTCLYFFAALPLTTAELRRRLESATGLPPDRQRIIHKTLPRRVSPLPLVTFPLVFQSIRPTPPASPRLDILQGCGGGGHARQFWLEWTHAHPSGRNDAGRG
jgi:hypothetical protein